MAVQRKTIIVLHAFCCNKGIVVFLQGKDFWLRYLLTYRSFSSHHSFIGRTAPTLPHFSELVDWIFIQLHNIFVDGVYQRYEFMCYFIISGALIVCHKLMTYVGLHTVAHMLV